jgi:hypothetical protein
MKTKVISNLALSVFSYSFTGSSRAWRIEVINRLSYPIYVDATIYRKYKLGPIQADESAAACEYFVSQTVSPKAHREIRRISVFSESKELLMTLQGKEMDKYAIFMGKNKLNEYIVRLEVKEEYIGIGLNNEVNLEEKLKISNSKKEENNFQ